MSILNDAPVQGSNPVGTMRAASSARPGRETRVKAPRLRRHRRVIGLLLVALVALVIVAGLRLSALVMGTNDELLLRIGNEQVTTINLQEALPLNADFAGVNIFPQAGTLSLDNASGPIDYPPQLTSGLTSAHIALLRYPGGSWGETHYLSRDQLVAFTTLLEQVHADGMVQARLSGPVGGKYPNLVEPAARADVAASWVDFLNNPSSDWRTGKYLHAPFHPVKYWTVGDEPDKLIDPATGKLYLVKDYVQDFIQFSIAMHKADPSIMLFGPEISQYAGPGSGPVDANGESWMGGFLQGVGAYEQAHHVKLLDGVSFHVYQFANGEQSPALLMSSTDAWNYLLPSLHQLIGQSLRRDVPIAITEINTNAPGEAAPSRGEAALWWADTLGTLMNQQVSFVAFSPALGGNTPYPLFTSNGQLVGPTPMFRVMELFAHMQQNLIPLAAQRDPISVYATEDNAHQTLSLLFVNKSGLPQLAQLVPQGSSVVSGWRSVSINLRAYSMTVITLHRGVGAGSTAEAYSYGVPAVNDSSTGPLEYTLCGGQFEAFVNRPC